MKEVLLFILPTLSGGGRERVVSRLSKYLQKYYDQYLVLLRKDRIDYEFSGRIIQLNTYFNLVTAVFQVVRIKNNLRPRFSLSFGPKANTINVISNFFCKYKPKIVLSVRAVESVHFKTYFPWFLRKCYFLFTKFNYQKADVIVGNSLDIKNDLIKNFRTSKKKTKIIYNPIDLAEIEKLSQESLDGYRDLFQDNRVVITIGRLSKEKNHRLLIQAFANLIKLFKDIQLVILGEGELLKELEILTINLGISEKVHFLGFQRNPFKFLKNSHIFVLSSLYEGFPNVLLEAMALGLPVVSSNCPGGVKEILLSREKEIKDIVFLGDFGILVETNSLSALEKGIKLLLENDDLREEYSKRGKLRAKDFAIEKIVQEWLNLLCSKQGKNCLRGDIC